MPFAGAGIDTMGRRRGAMWVGIGLACTLVLAGCNGGTKETPPTPEPVIGNAENAAAKKVRITKDSQGHFVADVPILSLSQGAKDMAQWKNDTDETIVVILASYGERYLSTVLYEGLLD